MDERVENRSNRRKTVLTVGRITPGGNISQRALRSKLGSLAEDLRTIVTGKDEVVDVLTILPKKPAEGAVSKLLSSGLPLKVVP